MLAIELAAILAALFICSSGAAVDYCGAAMCGMSNAHTFCQYTEGPGPRCSGYIDDRLSGEEKARVIGRMNLRRNEAALGNLQLPPASNMLKLRWVEELAREAQLWADQCSPPSYPEQHDACRDLFAITVGQCVASVVGEAPGLRPESMVDMWYLQGRQSDSIHSTDVQKSTADFAQMLWSHAYLVGCARSRFMIEQNGRLRTVTRLVCNFAPRAEGPLWTPGPPASACPARSAPDPALPGLCTFHDNVSFTYDVTNVTVLKEQSILDTILEIDKNESLNYHGSLDQIYLTKMVAASINNQTEQQHQNDSTEKIDVVEANTDDKEDTLNVTDNNRNIIDDVIEKMINETSTSTAPVTKKRLISLITVGRPQSYNIEELNVVMNKSEYGTTRPVTVKKYDDYNDYGPDDMTMAEQNYRDYIASASEGNVTAEMAPVEIERITETTLALRSSTISSYIIESTSTNPSGNEANQINPVPDVEITTPYVQNDILKRLLDLSEKNDQNPSDPETARQLEEALEHMEKALASPPSSSKVRRALHPDSEQQTQEPINNEPSPKKERPKEPTEAQKLKEIGTPDSAPIMAILNKYAPLMKSYGSIFSRSEASNTTLSLVLFVIGSLVSNIL